MKPVPHSQPPAVSHRRFFPLVLAILMTILATRAPLLARDVGDYKAGEIVAALQPDAARSLSAEAQAFLLASGPEESLPGDEKASLAALRRAVAK